MIYVVKKGIGADRLMDNEGQELARIMQEKQGIAIEAQGVRLMVREEKKRELSVSRVGDAGEQMEATAVMTLEEETHFIRPPRAVSLEVSTQQGTVTILQDEMRSYTVRQGRETAAMLACVNCVRPKLICSQEVKPAQAALIYVLCARMDREDELVVL